MASRAAQIAGHLNYPKGLLVGQVAIITGSGQGIGAEAARLFVSIFLSASDVSLLHTRRFY